MEPKMLLSQIQDIITRRGAESYLGEEVSMEEHMLQAAMLAESQDGSDEAIAGALLHDLGHYSGEFPEDALEQGENNYHEETGAKLLRGIFPENVVESVRLHVSAKRYLCATDTEYFGLLSEASVQSLKLQGGPMNENEVSEFKKNPFLDLCVQVRRWDDAAKVPGTPTPPFKHFLPVLERLVSKK